METDAPQQKQLVASERHTVFHSGMKTLKIRAGDLTSAVSHDTFNTVISKIRKTKRGLLVMDLSVLSA